MASSTSISMSWEDLPDVALVSVYHYLSDIEKLNTACACKNWYRMFGSPNLWRERRVMFHSLNAERLSEKERKFIQRYGHYLHKLTLGFGTPTFKSCMVISKAVDAYVKTVCSRNDIRLREIDFDHMHLEQHWHYILSRNRLITALCKLLRKQKFLEVVYFSGARAKVQDGCRILEALAKGPKSRTITSLYIEDFFETNVFPWRQEKYINAMSKFLALKHLHINYKYLNDVVLRNLANKLSRSLKNLSVILEGDLRGVEIPPDAWYELAARCPRAYVSAYLCTTLFRGPDLRPPFVSGIPLTDVYLTSWSRVDEMEMRLAVLLRHIARTYSSTLDNLAMFFYRHEHIDRDLMYLLDRCKNIRDLCLQCHLSADTVVNIMKLHHDRKLRLNSINLTISGLSSDSWDRIHQQKLVLLADVADFVHVGPCETGSSTESGSESLFSEEDLEEGEEAGPQALFNIPINFGMVDQDFDGDEDFRVVLDRVAVPGDNNDGNQLILNNGDPDVDEDALGEDVFRVMLQRLLAQGDENGEENQQIIPPPPPPPPPPEDNGDPDAADA